MEAWNQYDSASLEKEFACLKAETDALNAQNSFSFSHAAAEFRARTCWLGFVHDPGERMFVSTGYGTFINQNTILTSGNVYDLTLDALKQRVGTTVAFTGLGIRKVKLKSRYKWGDHVFLTVDDPDLSRWDRIMHNVERQQMLAILKPLDTPVKTRNVAFFNAPENNDGRRPTGGFSTRSSSCFLPDQNRPAYMFGFRPHSYFQPN